MAARPGSETAPKKKRRASKIRANQGAGVKAGRGAIVITAPVVDSTVVAGKRNTVATRRDAPLGELTQHIAELRRLIEAAKKLDPDAREVVEGDLEIVEAEVERDPPRRAIILARLRGITEFFSESAEAAAAAAKLLPVAAKAIDWVKHYLP